MFNTGLLWLVKSGEKAIIWGREKNWKVTEKSGNFILWLTQHSGNLKSLSKKVSLLTDIDFPNPGKTPYLENVKWREMEDA